MEANVVGVIRERAITQAEGTRLRQTRVVEFPVQTFERQTADIFVERLRGKEEQPLPRPSETVAMEDGCERYGTCNDASQRRSVRQINVCAASSR